MTGPGTRGAPRWADVGLLGGLAVVVGCVVALVAVLTPSATPPAGVSAGPAVVAAAPRPAPVSGPVPARADDPGARPEPAPVSVAIGGDVPDVVVPVGVARDGQMEVPQDVAEVGWYRFGPAPGAARGNAVLAGHVDDRVQGPGAFVDLDTVRAGDIVVVARTDGSERTFRVDTVTRVSKADVDLAALFDRTGPPRLALITCGGAFDRDRREYRDNVVALATPT